MRAELELRLRRHRDEQYKAELTLHDAQLGQSRDLTPASRPLVTLAQAELRDAWSDPKRYGQLLSQMLFGHPLLREALMRASEQAAAHGVPLRFHLDLDPEDLAIHALRWELLLDPATDTFLAHSEHVLLARTVLSSSLVAHQLPAPGSLRSVVAIASPSDIEQYRLPPIDTAAQLQALREGLATASTQILAGTVGAPVTPERLRAVLHQGVDLFYLVCHGSQDVLWLEDDNLKAKRLPGTELLEWIKTLPHPPTLIVLVTCSSAGGADAPDLLTTLGPRLVAAGVPAVIAMRGTISQSTARTVMKQLLREMHSSGEIDLALVKARAAVATEPDWWAPVLFTSLRDGRCFQMLPAKHFHIPFKLKTQFVGREEDLAALDRLLKPHATTFEPVTVALVGMGGVGKTRLAYEFAWRRQHLFRGGVFWIKPTGLESTDGVSDLALVENRITAIGGGLDLPGYEGLQHQEKLERVRRVWEGPEPCLIIFDDCGSPSKLDALLPHHGAARVLIVAQARSVGETVYQLGPLQRHQSVEMLGNLQGDTPQGEGSLVLDQIAHELGDLPLALDLAGRYLQQLKLSPGDDLAQELLDELRKSSAIDDIFADLGAAARVLNLEAEFPSIWKTFRVSYKALERSDERVFQFARALLARAAWFPPEELIAHELLIATLRLPANVREHRRAARIALQTLLGLGLLSGHSDGIMIHRLLARFVRDVSQADQPGARDDVTATLVEQMSDAAVGLEQRRDAAFWVTGLGWLERADAITPRELDTYVGLVGRLVEHPQKIKAILATISTVLANTDLTADPAIAARLHIYHGAMQGLLSGHAEREQAASMRAEAKAVYQKALALLAPLVEGPDVLPANRRAYAQVCLGLGRIALAPAESDMVQANQLFAQTLSKAAEHYARGFELAEGLSDDPLLAVHLGRERCYALGLLGHWEQAEAIYQRVHGLLQQLPAPTDSLVRLRAEAELVERYSTVRWLQGQRAGPHSVEAAQAFAEAYDLTVRMLQVLDQSRHMALKQVIAQLNAGDFASDLAGCDDERRAQWVERSIAHARRALFLALRHDMEEYAATARADIARRSNGAVGA